MLDHLVMEFMGNREGVGQAKHELFHKIFDVYDRQGQGRWFWIWGIYVEEQLCGHFELKETPHTQADELEIVYLLHPDARGNGLMHSILSFIKSIQGEWGRRLIATVSPDNKRSLSLLKKWGISHQEWISSDDGDGDYLKLRLSAL
jgi:RimJ/RimL family protein N-acetyltransferase